MPHLRDSQVRGWLSLLTYAVLSRRPLSFDSVVSFSSAFGGDAAGGPPPSSSVLNHLATLRQEPENEDDSVAHEGALAKERPWNSAQLHSREICDGQTLASPGRYRPQARERQDFPTTHLDRHGAKPRAPPRYSLRWPSGKLENAHSPSAVSKQ